MKKKTYIIILPLVFGLLLTGCLTSEFKEVRISLNPDGNGGTGSIVFSGIASEKGEDTVDQSKDDFNSLITEYYQGKTLENGMPGIKNVKKRLFVTGDQLNGEITFEFDDLRQIGIYRFNGAGPYMYYTLADGYFTSGQFVSSNGTFGGEKLPIIFWEESARDFFVKMSMSSQGSDRKPLAKAFTAWEKKR